MLCQRCFCITIVTALVFSGDGFDKATAQELNLTQLKERFGEQEFAPDGGFVLQIGQKLPNLVWEHPELVVRVVDGTAIPMRWFNERFEEVETAEQPGRYYAYGEAPVPSGPVLRRAMTCCCVGTDFNLAELAEARVADAADAILSDQRQREIDAMMCHWRTSEQGAIELAAIIEHGRLSHPSRKGQWQMEEATRHVQLKTQADGLGRQADCQGD